MTWQTPLFLVVAGTAFGVSAHRLITLFRLLIAQKGQGPSIQDFYARWLNVVVNVFGQKATLAKKSAGIMHATIFWGFLIITIGTLEQFSMTLHERATFEWIGPRLYFGLVLLQDIFALAVLFAVAYAGFRRWIIRPIGLGKSRDANIILMLTASLMISILLMNGFHLLTQDLWYQKAMPISKVFSLVLGNLQISQQANYYFYTFFKWVHILIVLGFAVYIPGSKHLHILAAGPNTFLRHLKREKAMRPINFEDEKITQYGAAKITDFSWKDTLDYYSCTECGRCQDLCPAFNTQKPLSPKTLILDLKDNLLLNKGKILSNKLGEIPPLVDRKNITEDVIWACTTCRACEIACPVFIQQVDKIYDIRRNLVMMESKFPQEVQNIFKNMETNATPWAFSSSDRALWAEGLNLKTAADRKPNEDMDVLLWVGCAGAYDDRNKKILKAFTNILKKAEVRFMILGNEEKCTGDPARRIGNEYLFQTLAKENVGTLNRYQVKKIVTACPHCFNTLKNEYPDFGGNFEVYHHSQFIAELIANGKIKPAKNMEETVTFHDSCYLGRWNQIYDAPREIIQSLPAARVVEMKSHHDQSMCCGAGGGRMWMEEKIGDRVNLARTDQAIATHASIVATSCPFCMTMLNDGIKAKDMQDKVRVLDIAELVNQSTI